MKSQTIVINNAQTHQKDWEIFQKHPHWTRQKTFTTRRNEVNTLIVERTDLSESSEFPFEGSC